MPKMPDRSFGLKPGDARVVRRQHCMRCDVVLAITIENEAWWRRAGYGSWVQERWYGKHFTCGNCGNEGTLPMDKPLSYKDGGIMQEVLR